MKDTKEKILSASMKLFSTKGYDSTTTKEISKEAGISEMTLFRYFQNKLNLKNYILENMFVPPNVSVLEKNITYSLEKDLMFISSLFSNFAFKNKILIKMKAKGNMSDQRHLEHMKTQLEPIFLYVGDYFEEMHKRKVINSVSKSVSRTYIISVLGLIAAILLEDGSKKMLDEEITNYTKIFIRGIKK